MTRRSHYQSLTALAVSIIIGISSPWAVRAATGESEVGSGRIDTLSGRSEPTLAPIFVTQEVVQSVPTFPFEGPWSYRDGSSLGSLVAEIEISDALTDDILCLASAVYFEARGEPLAGQLAVAQVVINRSESSRFPSSYCGVVYQRAQFSFVQEGKIPSVEKASSAWARAKSIAFIAHRRLWESEAQDALYFHANYVNPSWSRQKTTRARINQHIFYR